MPRLCATRPTGLTLVPGPRSIAGLFGLERSATVKGRLDRPVQGSSRLAIRSKGPGPTGWLHGCLPSG